MAKNNQKQKFSYFKTIVFFITLGFVPLLVYYSISPAAPEEIYLMPNSSERMDMFSYYKSWMFAICTILLGLNTLWDFVADNLNFDFKRALKNPFTLVYALFFVIVTVLGIANNLSGTGPAPSNQIVLFLFMMAIYTAIFLPYIFIASFRDKFKNHIPRPVAIAVVIFLMCTLMTSALTDYRYMTYFGAIERFESVFVLLGYIIILIEVAEFASTKRDSQLVFAALIFSATAIGVIGFFQLIGMDFFYTDFASRLVLGEAYNEGIRLSPRMNEAYATLYNPNCVGMYSAMMAPLALAAAVLWPKKSPMKYILFVTFAFGVVCLFGSNSSAGLAGSFAAFGTIVILVFANFLKNKKSMKTFSIVVGAVAVIVIGAMFVPAVRSRVMAMARKFIVLPQTDTEYGYPRDIAVEGNTAWIYKGGKVITITNEDGQVFVRDMDGVMLEAERLEPIEDENGEEIGGAAYYTDIGDWVDFSVEARYTTIVYREANFYQYFGVDGMGNILALGKNGEVVDLNTPTPSFGFDNYQRFASSRGYIWSKSFPLMLENVLVGNGVDAFIMAFPQDDVQGKTRFFGNPYIIIDKPHNMYIQTAVNTGFISFLAQAALFGLFLFWAVKKLVCIPKMNTPYYATLLGSTAGVIGYMVTGLSTDSTVSVAPIFWAVLGLGYACIYALEHGTE